MSEMANPKPMSRKLFDLALWVTAFGAFVVAYVKFMEHPAPRWTDYIFALIWIPIGLQHLLFPNPRWTPLSRYGIAGLFFALSILIFVTTIFD